MLPLIENVRGTIRQFRKSPVKNDDYLQYYVFQSRGKELVLKLDCKTRFMKNVENRNPGNNDGTIPFHLYAICSLKMWKVRIQKILMGAHHSQMKWCGTIIISWIFIFNIYGSQMKWCGTIIISWILIFNILWEFQMEHVSFNVGAFY